MNSQGPHTVPWHLQDIDELILALQSNRDGLSAAAADARLRTGGRNCLPEVPPVPIWRMMLRQFSNPLVYILVIAAIISMLIRDWRDSVFIFVILMINAVIGVYHESRAQASSRALRRLLQFRATVQRDRSREEIPAEELVPGDIVYLESGNRVPADLRLLSAHQLAIDQSLLTGESIAVAKDPKWQGDSQSPLAEQQNMCFAGSTVTSGRSTGMVVATGARTVVGQFAQDVTSSSGGKPPLLERMERFTRTIAIATILFSILIGIVGMSLGQHHPSDMFLMVIALAVAAIPEGLPIAMTIALAVATTRMARRGVIVRHLAAVEGLGSCTMIATDKTGTLTVNQLTVRQIVLPSGERFQVSGEGFQPQGSVSQGETPLDHRPHASLERLVRAAVLCNEAELGTDSELSSDSELGSHAAAGRGAAVAKDRPAIDCWRWRGDAVDVSLLVLGEKLGIRRARILAEAPQEGQIPFECEAQFSATSHRVAGDRLVVIKGAPERIFTHCPPSLARDRLQEAALELAQTGLRVLAFAEVLLEDHEHLASMDALDQRLVPLGVIGTIDPLRPGAREAIAQANRAGIRAVMVTGDHRITALAIARELGLAESETEILTGPELAALGPDELAARMDQIKVFARVAPRQKLQIVQAAQQAGHFVAVTGDGVNDAPALRMANIGVAMGKSGTDVAREAAELVISDDNFATIVAGIEEGRIAYDNIRKVIYLLISTGVAELVVMGLAILAGLPLPLLPVQLLWLNLVTNGIQDMALAMEPGEGGILDRPPRPPNQRIFDRLMIERTMVAAAVMGIVGFATFAWLLRNGSTEDGARNILLLLMVLFENFHLGNCRSETSSAFSRSPFRSPALLGAAVLALAIHIAVMHLPWTQEVLKTGPVSPTTWGITLLLAALIIPVIELHKLAWRSPWLSHRKP